MDHAELAERNLIFRCLSGSRAYGTSMPGSDVDVRGVFAADQEILLTPFIDLEHVKGEGDTMTFEISKFARMLAAQNPNVLELLWTDAENILHETPAWRLLRDLRQDLLTTKIRATYGGYASDQLKRMRSHERWINNPVPQETPVPADFVRIEMDFGMGLESPPKKGLWTLMPCGPDRYAMWEGGSGSWHDSSGNLRSIKRGMAGEYEPTTAPIAILAFDRKGYEEKKREHENYWRWRRERNQVKGTLEDKLGYEPKAASHMIRLLRTANEALREGRIQVRRPDAAELLSIRLGEWPMRRVLDHALELEGRLGDSEAASPLARELDTTIIGDAVMRIYETVWKAQKSRVALQTSHQKSGEAPEVRERVVVLDLEGSGNNLPAGGEIVEISAVEIMGGVRTGRVFHAHVRPQEPVSPFATRLHGLTTAFLADKPAFPEVYPSLLAFIGSAHVVTHNAIADAILLEQECRRAELQPIPRDRMACTQMIARRLIPGADMSLDTLCLTLGIDRAPRARGHSASLDAALAADCLMRLSALPGYQSLRGVRPGATKAERQEARTSDGRVANVTCHLSGDGSIAIFDRPGETSIEVPVPPYPVDTHQPIAHASGVLLIAPQGEPSQPSNPSGPSLIRMTQSGLRAYWLGDRGRILDSSGWPVTDVEITPSSGPVEADVSEHEPVRPGC